MGGLAMGITTVTRSFAQSDAVIIHQDGSQLSAPTKGVQVLLHTREGETTPCCAEVVSGEHHAEIGLRFAKRKLSDYDGVFFLPREVGKMLADAGYTVPEEFFA
jgi:hypothetical protein